MELSEMREKMESNGNAIVSFGGLVADLRKSQGLSQAEMAAKIGISRNYMSLIERNLADNISTGVFFALANILGIEPYDLFQAYKVKRQ
jgi:transcriptional regulator with XRE-family HTH domain